jgi:hypothetical protein
MKRQKHRVKRTGNQKTSGSIGAGAAPDKTTRRDLLGRIGSGALLAAALGGGGWYLVQDVSATIREQDLSQIGNGTPAVVQIHDPDCSLCAALQREARKALADFEDGELQFLVANIRSAEGKRLASAHGVGHVTLLLFDAKGRRRSILVGSNTSEDLKQAFRRHLARSGSS